MGKLPLSAIRVLDLSRVLAGPLAAQMLGDLGAEVIKIERPVVGDDARTYGPPYLKDGEGRDTRENAFFLSANRNKKSVTVNISTPQGQEIVRQIARECDVVVENYKVGDLKRYGLDYETIRAVNPRVIYCSVTGYGQTGPYANRPGYDPVFQAMGGLMSVTGYPDHLPGGGPMKVGPSIVDVITSLNMSTAILGALYHRDVNSAMGQYIDISLLDSVVASLSHYGQIYLVSRVPPVRRGTQGNGGMPAQMFACSDGQLMLSAGNDAQYVRLCKVVERPDLITHPSFCTNVKRVENRDEITAVFDAIFVEKPVGYWLPRLAEADIPSGPINNFAQVFAEEQVLHRELEVGSPHPLDPDLKVIRNPIRYSVTPIEDYAPPPMLGEHTDEILRGWLGLDDARMAELRAAGVI